MQHIKPKISIHVSRFFDRCIYVHSHNRHEFNGSDSRLLGQMYSSLSNSGYSIYLDDECFHRDAGTTGNLRTPTVNDLLRIRHACSSDVDSLTRIRREAILRRASEHLGSKGARDWTNSATSDRGQRAIEEHLVGVAELSGQPVGWVEVDRNQVKALYVHPEQAATGIGSKLLAYAECHIQSAGFTTVQLDASWNAEAFYRHRNYHPVGDQSLETGRPMMKTLDSLPCD